MFQKMTIRNHFLLLIYTIAFALIITGFLGLKSMYNLHDASSRIYQEHFAPLKELFSLESETLIPLKQAIIQGKEKEEAIVLAQKFLAQFDFFSSNYKKFIKNTHLDKFSLLATQLQQQIQTIQTSEELSKITSQLLLEVDVLIDTLVKEKYPEIEAQHTAMALSYPLQCTILTIVILLAGTLLALVSYPFIKELMRSMNTIIDGMKSFVSEDPDLTQRLSTHREDEIGQIAHHFNRLIDNLSDLIKRVQRSGIQVFGSATSISAASKQLESTVHHFTSFTGEIVTTAKTISQGSQNLVLTMTEVKHVANDTAALAGAGKEGLTQIESTISHMEEAFKAISSKLGTISEKAANITNVVTTITKIADQTNLLSLNASIEAEKAGEFGLGFAVIARETRRLADQTAVATLDIDKMVSEMKSSVSSGVMSIENFSRQLNQYVDDVRKIASQQAQIILHVQELTPQFERVHSVMQSQATGAGQITDAMVELSGMAQKSVEALKNSTLAIEQLNAAARGLQKEVSHFKVQN